MADTENLQNQTGMPVLFTQFLAQIVEHSSPLALNPRPSELVTKLDQNPQGLTVYEFFMPGSDTPAASYVTGTSSTNFIDLWLQCAQNKAGYWGLARPLISSIKRYFDLVQSSSLVFKSKNTDSIPLLFINQPYQAETTKSPTLNVCEPGAFQFARLFLPHSFRASNHTIRSRIRALQWCSPGTAKPEVLFALRLSRGEEHLYFWLSCPASMQAGSIRHLVNSASEIFNKVLGQSTLVLAGPVAAKGLDPKKNFLELKFELTLRHQTKPWSIYISPDFCTQVQNLLPNGQDLRIQLKANEKLAFEPLLGLNRLLLDRTEELTVAVPPEPDTEDIACALYDRIDALATKDFTLLLQNYLLPRGTQAILDSFFPRGGFDPLVWQRTSKTLGPKITEELSEAIKQGKSQQAGLTIKSLSELVQAVKTRRLELSPQANILLVQIVGSMVNDQVNEDLEALLSLALPASLLGKLSAKERALALNPVPSRTCMLALLDQPKELGILTEGLSKNGIQQLKEDFQTLEMAHNRGDITSTQIFDAKNEIIRAFCTYACDEVLGSWNTEEWKKCQSTLGAEQCQFLAYNPASCLAESPLVSKLQNQVAKREVHPFDDEPLYKLPALWHNHIATKLLELLAQDIILPNKRPR